METVFTRDGKDEDGSESRVNAETKWFRQCTPLKGVRAQLATHRGVLAPTLLHASESRVWQKKNLSRINAVKFRALQSMCETLKDLWGTICYEALWGEWRQLWGLREVHVACIEFEWKKIDKQEVRWVCLRPLENALVFRPNQWRQRSR